MRKREITAETQWDRGGGMWAQCHHLCVKAYLTHHCCTVTLPQTSQATLSNQPIYRGTKSSRLSHFVKFAHLHVLFDVFGRHANQTSHLCGGQKHVLFDFGMSQAQHELKQLTTSPTDEAIANMIGSSRKPNPRKMCCPPSYPAKNSAAPGAEPMTADDSPL